MVICILKNRQKSPRYKMTRLALYKCRTGKKQKKKHLISLDLSKLSLPIAGGDYKALILGPQLTGSRTSPTTDKPTKTATHFIPYCTSKQGHLIPVPQRYPSTMCPCIQTPPMLHSVAFLPPCSEIPNFAAKMQQRKLTFLYNPPRVPTDLSCTGNSRASI